MNSVNSHISIYETIYCKQNKIFNFNAHINRLKKGAKYLRLNQTINKKQIFQKIKKLLAKKDNLKESRVKIILDTNKITYKIDPIIKNKSNKLITVKSIRPIAHIKNNNRTIENLALNVAIQNNCIDALLVNNKNKITEGSISNFFGIKNNTIITSKNNILCGTTRALVIKIAKQNNIKIKFQQISTIDIAKLEGAFITNSIKKIVPIYQIDSHKIPKHNIIELLISKFPKDLFK